MRRYVLLVLTATFLMVVSACKKLNNVTGTNTPTLIAKWSLVVDSTYRENFIFASNAHAYLGVTGDYLDFRADNNCYIKKGSSYDTISYAKLTDTIIVFQYFYYYPASPEQAYLKFNSADNLTITTYSLPDPEGFEREVINLTK